MNEQEAAALAARSAARRQRMVTHRAANWAEAEQWDLEFWQSRTPEERLSALVAIHEDVRKARVAAQDPKDRPWWAPSPISKTCWPCSPSIASAT